MMLADKNEMHFLDTYVILEGQYFVSSSIRTSFCRWMRRKIGP